MGGSLVHSRTFRIARWNDGEGGTHYEVGPDKEGDYDFFSYTTWGGLKQYCASFGMDPEVWPDFTDYPCGIDVPLDEVAAKQGPFRRAVESLPPEAVARNDKLARIAEYLRRGEQVFFC